MDSLTEDVDAEMTALRPDDVTGQNLEEAGDEVENLRNSLREAVHDDNVRPKMQCLMMDSCFSMVTMQGEDSGIAWETTPSRGNTPWPSEAGNPTVDLRPATPGSLPAGRIIFVMDEEMLSRRRREKVNQKVKGQREVLAESSENVSGRPELVEVSQPNVKTEEGDEEEDGLGDKEQQLFSLVSEGSEILNIVVPPKLATVDEEESRDMVDNLSYLEESVVPKASEEAAHDNEPGSDPARGDQVEIPSPIVRNVMDPPGAPVARPPGRGAAGHVDYFEAFTPIDARAPGGPAVTPQGQVEPEAEIQASETPVQSEDTMMATVDVDKSDTISLVEITNELLDEVFYGGTDSYVLKTLHKEGESGAPSRVPSKASGSTLFGSQEDILTPIFLPEGPPKIIDQILLEEPKAMAFLYDDLYEEATGSRVKEEDTESMRSEKSFHSRHSDREARGYLEKYVLIDETPAVEVERRDEGERPEEGPRVLTQELYDFGDLLSKPERGEMPNSEEEITDFFRSSGNSSPCDVDPFPRSLDEDEPQPPTETKDTTNRKVSIKVENVAGTPVEPTSVSSYEFLSEEPGWGSYSDDRPAAPEEKGVGSDQEMWKQGSETQKPVAPPRRKAASAPKARLDLTPLTPVEVVTEETEEAGGKEQREEEKEAASGDDGEETTLSGVNLLQSASAAVEAPRTDIAVRDTRAAAAPETDAETAEGREASETEAEEEGVTSSGEAETEVDAEKRGGGPTEAARDKGQCVIL